MQNSNSMQVRCAQCTQPVEVQVRTIVDVQSDPQGKSLLLSNRLNSAECPNCGYANVINAPLLYHDASKELLIAYVPMEVGVRQGQNEEKIVGDMMNQLTATLDAKNFKSYMFNPKRALTMQGVVDQVLEADGITKEMVEAQRQRVTMVQDMVRMEPDALHAYIVENDANITDELFQIMSVMAQNAMQQGQRPVLERLSAVQDALLEHSTAGKRFAEQQATIESVIDDLRELGGAPTSEQLADLVVEYADSDEKIQAFVGLIGSQLDDEFFAYLSAHIESANAADREKLSAIQSTITDYQAEVEAEVTAAYQALDAFIEELLEADDLEGALSENYDAISSDFVNVLTMKLQQAEEAGDEARLEKLAEIYGRVYPIIQAQFLQTLINSDNPQALIRANIQLIDQNFMNLLAMNANEAQKRGNQAVVERFTRINNIIVPILQESMPPEARFINDLLGAESDEAMKSMIDQSAAKYGEGLMEIVDAFEQIFQQQGNPPAGMLDRLNRIRTELTNTLN